MHMQRLPQFLLALILCLQTLEFDEYIIIIYGNIL